MEESNKNKKRVEESKDEIELKAKYIPDVELKTIEIDVKNRKFLVNGKEFGKDAHRLTLCCNASSDVEKWWQIALNIEANVTYLANYDIDGKQTSAEEIVRGKSYKED